MPKDRPRARLVPQNMRDHMTGRTKSDWNLLRHEEDTPTQIHQVILETSPYTATWRPHRGGSIVSLQAGVDDAGIDDFPVEFTVLLDGDQVQDITIPNTATQVLSSEKIYELFIDTFNEDQTFTFQYVSGGSGSLPFWINLEYEEAP